MDAAAYCQQDRDGVSRRRFHGRGQRRSLAVGLVIASFFYLVTILADFIAPYDYRAQSRWEPVAPPSALHLRDARGRWHARPFFYPRRLVDPLLRSYAEDESRPYPLELFARGYRYKLFGIFFAGVHLFGTTAGADDAEAPRFYLLGTDSLGRDRFSRLLIAARFSLCVGPLGALLAGFLGIVIGCVAGYAGRWVDAFLMRWVDAMMALPTLILILAARAAFPLELPAWRAAVLLLSIFVVLGWAEMARLTRGLVKSLRQQEFVLAAQSLGLSPARVLARHILPNASGPLIVQLSLMVPAFILAETALSFLGVGLQEPEASWGALLSAASDINLLRGEHALVLLAPAMALTAFVFAVRLISGALSHTPIASK